VTTAIVIKYSTANTSPEANTLLAGEFAYSYASGNLFIGKEDGTFDIVGGKTFTDFLKTATRESVPNSLVFRDSNGLSRINFIESQAITSSFFTGDLIGNASTADSFSSNVVVNIVGNVTGNLSTNFSGDTTLSLNLENILLPVGAVNLDGVGQAGVYGSANLIPIIEVDEKGRITNVSVALVSVASEEFANAAFNRANSATILAQAAYDAANSSTPAFNQQAFQTANQALQLANSASIFANTPSITSNTALILAQSAFDKANTSANATSLQFFAANTANLALIRATNSYAHANAAFESSNILFSIQTNLNDSISALSALSSNAFIRSANADSNAVSALIYANGAYSTANYALSVANTISNSKLSITGGSITGSLDVAGNLTVRGGVTFIESNQINIGDAILNLNADINQSANPTENAGLSIDRGLAANVALLWNETTDKWTFTNDGTNYLNIASVSGEEYANAAYLAANSSLAQAVQTLSVATAAFTTANIGVIGANYANSAFRSANTPSQVANSAYIHANAAFALANTLTLPSIDTTIVKANLAYIHANASFNQANLSIVVSSYANSAFSTANSASIYANAAFAKSNTLVSAGETANLAYNQGNVATIIALSAYAKANSVIGLATGQLAYDQANSAFDSTNAFATIVGSYANSAFAQANTLLVNPVDFFARAHSNAAFARANVSLNTQTGGTVTGDVTVIGNLTVEGNSARLRVSGLLIQDPVVDISSETSGTPSQNAGVRVIRGDESPVQIRWNEISDVWQFTNDGATFYDIAPRSIENYANAAYIHSNAAFGFANTANQRAIISGEYANASYLHANAAYINSNSAFNVANLASSNTVSIASYANSAYIQSNGAFAFANAAFNQSNATAALASSAILNSVLADQKVGITSAYANSAYLHANASYSAQNASGSYANSAYAQANSLVSGATTANAAFDTANAAFNFANTRFASAGGIISGDVQVAGNLVIVGQTTYANTQTVLIADNIITLNAAIGEAVTPSFDSGIEIKRGNQVTVSLVWDESRDKWHFTNNGTNYSDIGSAAAEIYANAAFLQANTANTFAAEADEKARNTSVYTNAAFALANTKFASAGGTISGDVVITGNVSVQGNSATFSVPNFTVEDGIIDVNSEQVGPGQPTQDAGIRVVRGDAQATFLRWNESVDAWQFTNDGLNYNNISSSSAETYANNSYIHANSSYDAQNTTGNYANAAFSHANTGNTRAVISGSYANSSYIKANSAYDRANVNYTILHTVSNQDSIANGPIWQTNTAVVFLASHGTGTGTSGGFKTPDLGKYIAFNGPGERTLTSRPLNLLAANYFVYNSIAGSDTNGGEEPEVDEDLYLAYSLNGITFTDITQLHEVPSLGGPTTWTTQYVELPFAAKTPSTYLRVYQRSNSGLNADNFGLRWAAVTTGEQDIFRVINEMLVSDRSNVAPTIANASYIHANASYVHANAAYAFANTKLAISGGTITGSLIVAGNLTIQGNTTSVDVETLRVSDPILLLANTNETDFLDIGFTAHYGDGITQRHTGLVRHAETEEYYLFDNYESHFLDNNVINIANSDFRIAKIHANVKANSIISRGYELTDYINVVYTHANVSFSSQNTSSSYANSAFETANTLSGFTASASSYANSAFNSANTALNDSLAFAIALG